MKIIENIKVNTGGGIYDFIVVEMKGNYMNIKKSKLIIGAIIIAVLATAAAIATVYAVVGL